MKPIYLDHNATTPMPPEVRQAFLRAVDEDWGNPSSAHAQGQRAAAALDRARDQVAALGGWSRHRDDSGSRSREESDA